MRGTVTDPATVAKASSPRRPTWSELHRGDDPRTSAQVVDTLRSLPPAGRLAQVAGLIVAVRRLALVGLRRRHPRATEPELDAMLMELLYGPAVAQLARRSPTATDTAPARP